MKIGIIGDIHWSKYSSIIRNRGNKYSTRLENCIQSINWAEEVLDDCDIIVYLGDFFDSDILKSEEITALSEIKWNKVPHKFLVGNHELGLNDLSFSSAHLFNLDNKEVVDHPIQNIYNNFELCFLPYQLDTSKSLETYFNKSRDTRIIFSHNDISGVQLGKFISKSGFSIEDIEDNCDLFINGHIHNGSKITNKIYNVGNLTGQNFSEDAKLYKHNILTIEIDDNSQITSINRIENPYAIKFYKFDSLEDLINFEFFSNSVITAKLYTKSLEKAKSFVNNNDNIIAHRFIVSQNINTTNNISLSIDHLERFQEFVIDKFGKDTIIIEELEEVLK